MCRGVGDDASDLRDLSHPLENALPGAEDNRWEDDEVQELVRALVGRACLLLLQKGAGKGPNPVPWAATQRLA